MRLQINVFDPTRGEPHWFLLKNQQLGYSFQFILSFVLFYRLPCHSGGVRPMVWHASDCRDHLLLSWFPFNRICRGGVRTIQQHPGGEIFHPRAQLSHPGGHDLIPCSHFPNPGTAVTAYLLSQPLTARTKLRHDLCLTFNKNQSDCSNSRRK